MTNIPDKFDLDLLTSDAYKDHLNFTRMYGDGNCSCHLSPPCGSCIHPGNPVNLMSDETAWETSIIPQLVENATAALAAFIDERVKHHLTEYDLTFNFRKL